MITSLITSSNNEQFGKLVINTVHQKNMIAMYKDNILCFETTTAFCHDVVFV